MNYKNLLFILNPNAGKGEIRSKAVRILQLFSSAGYDVLVSPTSRAGEIPEIIQRRANGVDLVVCCGGDGTLNETVTGLMKLDPRPPLGYLPAGTVNDFASSLGISKDLEGAAQAVLSGSPVDVDIGRFGEQYFTYVAAFGAFTEVSYQTPQQSKNVFGRTAYVLEGLKRLTSLKSYQASIEYDSGTCQGDYLFGMISNSSSVGGLKLLDDAQISMNDGMFEVILIQKPDSLTEMQQVINAVLLHDYSSPLITGFRTSNLTVSCENETPWTLDGEFGGAPEKVEIENLHLALRVIL
ncbi:diacylglycerol kinase family lipid kinase [bacterium 1XD42-1]|jgi:YegS/Rv2252/BmrU family lipid kinase|nr:diacylglycerol kinase family lipid kinase [Oscillospiraceae bacterium]MCI9668124.1 diacylglycerol kinase family lipid kinase [Oscillospiraceae bacterium]RKJ63503.1 diacylglycerol kinase family lipid kinase [bacterium 1XD42-1]